MSTTLTKLDLDQLFVTTMRTLAIDAIQQANSGHLGTPMGMSPTFGASAPLKVLQGNLASAPRTWLKLPRHSSD